MTFDLVFEDTGTYTAYFRARGFGSGSDSLYTPDGFGADPDNQENLSQSDLEGTKKNPDPVEDGTRVTTVRF